MSLFGILTSVPEDQSKIRLVKEWKSKIELSELKSIIAIMSNDESRSEVISEFRYRIEWNADIVKIYSLLKNDESKLKLLSNVLEDKITFDKFYQTENIPSVISKLMAITKSDKCKSEVAGKIVKTMNLQLSYVETVKILNMVSDVDTKLGLFEDLKSSIFDLSEKEPSYDSLFTKNMQTVDIVKDCKYPNRIVAGPGQSVSIIGGVCEKGSVNNFTFGNDFQFTVHDGYITVSKTVKVTQQLTQGGLTFFPGKDSCRVVPPFSEPFYLALGEYVVRSSKVYNMQGERIGN
jgi:hypothetical protein